MKLTATCPTCGAELELEDIAPGTAVECPACNHALTVPEPPAARVAEPKKRLRLPSRQAAASVAPVYIPVPAKPRGIIGGAFHGCGVLFVMLLILIAVIIGCNVAVLGGAASAIEHASAWRVDQKPGAAATSPAAAEPKKSVGEVVAAKAAQMRAAKQGAQPSADQPVAPTRSAWRTITYIGGDDREHPALVGDDRSGGCLVIRDPRGACLFEIQTPRDLPMGGASEWTGPIQVGDRVLSTEQWFRQGDRVGMMRLVDARGDFDPGHGRDLLARLVAENESESITVGYLRPRGGKWVLFIPLRGLRAAVDALPPL